MTPANVFATPLRGKKEIDKHMKKLTAFTSALLLTIGMAFAGSPTEADQKWLEIVEKKIIEGQARVSTPSESRVELLKEWASTKGYTLTVTKTDESFQVEATRAYAQK